MCGWLLHAYVLMGNHFHLAVETPEPSLVQGMHWLLDPVRAQIVAPGQAHQFRWSQCVYVRAQQRLPDDQNFTFARNWRKDLIIRRLGMLRAK